MSTRVTQADIARAAGVHNTTVSLALRNSPLIPPATRERIQAIAKAKGYCPDPALQALVAYRKARHHRPSGETLAYVTRGNSQWGWRRQPIPDAQYHAAIRKAAELGYHLEHFWLGAPGMSCRRLDSVLLHRGIRGVILATGHGNGEDCPALDWSRLAAVQLGDGTANPALPQVALDPAGIVRLAMQHVLYAGHRRIGFVLPHRWDKLTDQVWSAAFHAEQYRCHLKDRLPVLHLQSPLDADPAEPGSVHHAANDATSLLRWHHQYRPEVVLGSSPLVLQHLRRCGYQVPGDFAYADLLLNDASGTTAGVWVDAARMGELAVESIAARLQQNLLGLPPVATATTVSGLWRPGSTLPGRPAEAIKATVHPVNRTLFA